MEINKQTQNEEDIETGRELAQQPGLADNPVYAPQEELGRRDYQAPETVQPAAPQSAAQEQKSFGDKVNYFAQWYVRASEEGYNKAVEEERIQREAPKYDLMKLEYPAAAQWIDEQRATGKSDKEIHRYLAETEMMSNFVYGDKETDKKLGRTDETWHKFWAGTNAQKEAAYIEIFKDEMSPEEVRDILRDAEVTKLPPSLLFTSPEIRKKAREMAGERLEGVKYLGAAVSNMIAGLNRQDVEKSRLELEEWKQALNDENKILQEAEAELSHEYGDAPRRMHSKEELLDIGRNRIKRFIAWKEKDIKTDEADEKSWRVNVRPSKSAIGRFLFNAIENSGMTIMSGIRSGAAWVLGGPLFGILMTAYNTYDESRTEAGSAFVAAKERGMSDEEAYKQAHKVFLKNLATLAITNSLGDITTFMLGHAGSLLTKAGATGTGKFLSSIAATGGESILSNIANQIGNKTFAAKLLQQFVVKGIPFVGGAIPEGLEEWLQDLYQMQAVGDEIDYNQLADSFWSGAAQAMLYSMFGIGVNTAVGAIGNRVMKEHARRTLNFLPEDIRADFKAVLNLGGQLDSGKIKADDVVREEKAVFLPQDVINENMRSELEIREDNSVTEEAWNKFAEKNPEYVQELNDIIEHKTRGITASEEYQAALDRLSKKSQNALYQATPEAEFARKAAAELAAQFRASRDKAGADITDEQINFQSMVYGHYLLASAERFGVDIEDFHRTNFERAWNSQEAEIVTETDEDGNQRRVEYVTITDEDGNQQRVERNGGVQFNVFQHSAASIHLSPTANASTFLHELSHIALDDLLTFGRYDTANDEVKGDLEIVMKYLGITDADIEELNEAKRTRHDSDEAEERYQAINAKITEAHELWARTGEDYFKLGIAPNVELQGVFSRIRNWMLEIYKGIKSIAGVDIPWEVKEVFDRMLAFDTDLENATISQLMLEEALLGDRIKSLEQASGQVNQDTDKFISQELTDYFNSMFNQTAFYGTPDDELGAGSKQLAAHGWGVNLTASQEAAERNRTAGVIDKVFTGKRGKSKGVVVDGKRYTYDAATKTWSDGKKPLTSYRGNVLSRIAAEPDISSAINFLNHEIKRLQQAAKDGSSIDNEELKALKWAKGEIVGMETDAAAPKGSLFVVDAPENNVLLDWDKGISGQPEAVINALNKLKAKLKNIDTSFFDDFDAGQTFYELLGETLAPNAAWEIQARAASDMLNRYGIPGLTYAADNTRGFTIWNEGQLKLMGVDSPVTGMGAEASKKFIRDVTAWAKKVVTELKEAKNAALYVIKTPAVFQFSNMFKAGSKPLDLALNAQKIGELGNFNHPEVTDRILKQLPRALTDPIAIFKSDSRNDSIVVMTDLRGKVRNIDTGKTGMATIIAPVLINNKNLGYDNKNIITSVYGKAYRNTTQNGNKSGLPNNEWFINQIKKDNLLYINRGKFLKWYKETGFFEQLSEADKKEFSQWVNPTGRYMPAALTAGKTNVIVPDERNLVKFFEQDEGFYQATNASTEQDSSFLTQEKYDAIMRSIFDQTAYHGTRHNLGGGFDLSYIGTGEGSQVYGWGIYLAESRNVAEIYRESGKFNNLVIYFPNGKKYKRRNFRDWDAPNYLYKQVFNHIFGILANKKASTFEEAQNILRNKYQEELKNAKEKLSHGLKEGNNATAIHIWDKAVKERQVAIFILNSISKVSPNSISLGNIYTVDVPENDVLLDWDAKISEQPEAVKEAIKQLIAALRHEGFKEGGAELYSKAFEVLLDPKQTGKKLYEALRIIGRDYAAHVIIGDTYTNEIKWRIQRPDQVASMLLNKYGIPGLRYWDKFSRQEGEGTHNFVIWNTDLLKIMGVEGDASEFETYNQTAGADDIVPEEQVDAVRKRYEGTAQWLKAPNGKQSNLDERAWLQVRTPAFKQWFGDWENNPAEASKALDENGEPLVVWHGTEQGGFSEFSTQGRGRTEGTGAWFTSRKDTSSSYAGRPLVVETRQDEDGNIRPTEQTSFYVNYPVFLNLRNPYVLDAKGRYWNELRGRKTTNDVARAVRNGLYGKDRDGVIIRNVVDFGDKDLSYIINYMNHKIDGTADVYVAFNPDQIKSATDNTGTFDPNNPNIFYQIGQRRKDDMDKALQANRTDLSAEQRADVISEIEKLGEQVKAGGNPKVEKAATHWVLGGHIILPEDNYKILDAIKICEQQHIDPMTFADPNEILAKYTIKESKADKRVNPDTVREFSNKQELPHGITVYTVQDDEAGQAAVRKIIDTHWGEDANPWCLAAWHNGSLDGDAWYRWEYYNAIPKRIAFKDGKLLAFSANSNKNIKWWDREDSPSDGIPFTVKENGDVFTYIYDEENGDSVKSFGILKDGTRCEFHKNGQMSIAYLPDGTKRMWHENGQMSYEKLPDKTERVWYENGQLSYEALPDGTYCKWYENGQMSFRDFIDGTQCGWYETGEKRLERTLDGTVYQWYKSGQKEYEKLPDGTQRWYREDGTLIEEYSPKNSDNFNQIIGKNGAYRLDALDEQRDARRRLNALEQARQMEITGAHPKRIKLRTGWERGVDGKWRYEILDGNLILKNIVKDKRLKLPDVYNNPELYKAYPALKNTTVVFTSLDKSIGGSYNANTNTIKENIDRPLSKWRSGIVHEIQHAIQYLEGFAYGMGITEQELNTPKYDRYMRAAGEVEARNAQKRIDWDMDKRWRTLIDDTDRNDVRRNRQIIMLNGREVYNPIYDEVTQLNQIKTPEFKAFFGDWENDPKNASKVVDEDGKPLLVWHGTERGGFSEFNTDGYARTTGTGAWFTSSKKNASTYSGTMNTLETYEEDGEIHAEGGSSNYPVFLNIRNPYIVEGDGRPWSNLGDLYIYDNDTDETIYEKADHTYFYNKDDAYDYIENELNDEYHERYSVYDEERTTNNIAMEVRGGMYGDGYDGVIFRNIYDSGAAGRGEFESDVYVVFNPNQIKSATDNIGTFDPNNPNIFYQIGKQRKVEMSEALKERRPNMTEEERAATIAEIEKLGERIRKGGSPKVEKAAVNWVLNGHIVLPKDNDKIWDAVRVCEQKHLNPLDYNDPNDILVEYKYRLQPDNMRTDPDKVDELSDKQNLPNGIVTYAVEDSKAGQAAVREIIDTNWGKDANPWCLTTRKNGSLDRAWEYWNSYNAYEKRIAFLDGHLLAFSANDDERVRWWDKWDDYSGLTSKVIMNEPDINFSNGKIRWFRKEGIKDVLNVKVDIRNGMATKYFKDGTSFTGKIISIYNNHMPRVMVNEKTIKKHGKEVVERTILDLYDTGEPMTMLLPDGTERGWYDNGQIDHEYLPDGTKRYWNMDGQIAAETLPDGTKRRWYENGQMSHEHLPDGTDRDWYYNGQISYEKLPDGTKRRWYNDGRLEYMVLPDGTILDGSEVDADTFNQTAQPAAEASLAADERAWGELIDRFKTGKLTKEERSGLLPVMQTPLVFKLVGMDLLPVEIRLDNLNKILNKKHKLSAETLKQIPRAITDPIMIFKSEHDVAGERDSRVILTGLKEAGKDGIERNVVAAIRLSRKNISKGYEINELTTVYRKDTSSKQQLTPEQDIIDWISKTYKDGTPMDLLMYINKEKASKWSVSEGLSPIEFDTNGSLLKNIPDETDLVKLRQENETFYQVNTIEEQRKILLAEGENAAREEYFINGIKIKRNPQAGIRNKAEAEPLPSEFKTLDNGVIQRQENEQPLSEFSLDGGFYIYLNGHKFDADMMTFNQIGKRRKQDMDMALHKRFPLMTEEQRTSTINEIEKLGENLNNGQGDAKAEKYAFHWVMNSGIVLPEDNDKIITGIKICEKHKINAFQKNAPTLGEILEKYTQVEEPDNVRVNPDVYLGKEFSEKKEYPFGITVYTIDEGREEEDTPLWWDQDNIDIDKAKKAQMAVRKIIDTHWGKDANPWCLASRKSGLDKAFELWKYYTAEAKRIAFVNGKLAGFYAGDVSNLCTWWNRRDEKTDGIPLVFKDNDGTVFEGRYNDEYYDDEEYNEESDDYRAVITKVIYPDKIEREFYLNGNLKSEKRPDGTIHRWYYNGAPMEEIMPDGTHYKWDERGNIIGFMLPNGVYREYSEYDRERIEFDELPDGTRLYYFDDNKTIKSKHRPNGTIITYYRSGGIEQLLLSDGTLFKWRENGTMESIERESDGFLKEFYDDGTPKHAEDNNGFIQDWNSEGRVVTIEDPDTGYSYSFETYSDGTPQHEEDSNGLLRDWNRQGILIYEDDPVTGRQFEAKEDGTPQYESSPDGEREWDDDGNLTYSTYPEDQDSIYREDEDEEYDEDDSYDDDENETFYQTNQAADLPFEDDEYLSPDAVKDVDGWLQWNDEYQNKIDLYKNERAAFKAIRELGGIRYQDLVDALGEALAKDLRSAFPTLFRKSGGQEQLPVDVLLQNLNEHTELQIPQFEYVDDFIDWLYKTSLERPKRPAPIVEINPDTEDALISRLGLDGAREYTKVRREYLNKLQKRIQAEYDRDKSNEKVKGDLEATYLEQQEIDKFLGELREIEKQAKNEAEADRKAGMSDEQLEMERRYWAIWDDLRNERAANTRHENVHQAAKRENISIEEAFKRGYAMAEKYSKQAYEAGLKEGKAQQREKYKNLKELSDEKDALIGEIKHAMRDKGVIWNTQQRIKKLIRDYNSKKDKKMADLRALHEQVIELQTQGRQELDTKNNAIIEHARKISNELASTMADKKKDWDKGKAGKIKERINAAILGAQRFFDRLDGGKFKFNGPWIKYFVDAMNTAQDKKLRNIKKRRSWLRAKLKEFGLSEYSLGNTKKIDVPKFRGQPWTVDRLMSIYAGLKNDKSRAAILYGNFADAQDEQEALSWAAQCVKALTPNEIAFADAVMEEYEMNYMRIQKELIDIYNEGMGHEKNYTPMKRVEINSESNLDYLDTAKILIHNPDATGNVRARQINGVGRDFSRSRAEIPIDNQTSIDLGLYAIWNNQIEFQEHAIAYARPVRDLRLALSMRPEGVKQSLQQVIKNTLGKHSWRFIENYLSIAARNRTLESYDVLDGVSGWIAKNMTNAYLCANLATILKQTTSIGKFLPYCQPQYLIISLGEFMARNKKFLDECYELDPQLEDRAGNIILQSLKAGEKLGIYGKMIDAGKKPIEAVDRWTSAIGFKAVYDYNIAKGKSQEEAAREAQRAVLLTQTVTNMKDASMLYQQKGLLKLALIFTNDLAQTFGIAAYDLAASLRGGNVPKFLYTIAGVALTATLLGYIVQGGPDDDENFAEFVGNFFTRQGIESIPLIGKAILSLWDGNGYALLNDNPLAAPVQKLYSGARKLTGGTNTKKRKDWYGTGKVNKGSDVKGGVLDVLEGVALMGVPFPSTAVRRVQRAVDDISEGEIKNAGKRILGQRIKEKKKEKKW